MSRINSRTILHFGNGCFFYFMSVCYEVVGCTKDLADRMTKKILEKLEVMTGNFFFQLCHPEMDVLIQCSNQLSAIFNVHSVDIQ